LYFITNLNSPEQQLSNISLESSRKHHRIGTNENDREHEMCDEKVQIGQQGQESSRRTQKQHTTIVRQAHSRDKYLSKRKSRQERQREIEPFGTTRKFYKRLIELVKPRTENC
jgi:hypothetical protein